MGVTSTMMRSVSLLVLLAVSATSALELTPDNFDEVTSGKQVFLKFLAPW